VRSLAVLLVLVLLALGVALVSVAGNPTSGISDGSGGASNRRAASRDDELLLGRLVLPAGARSSSREPAGGGPTLAGPFERVATPDVVDRRAWWVVPGRPASALAFIRAHLPAGSRISASGSGGGRGNTTSWFLQLQWPPITGVLQERALIVELVALPGGATGVRADAQDVWVIPRPAGERIPFAARVLEVAVARPHMRPSVSRTVTDMAEVSRIAATIDHLPTVQPGTINCPSLPVDGPLVTFTFRATLRGQVLAQASEAAWASEPTTACDPLRLTISGREQAALLGGASVIQEAQAMLGVSLHRPLR
jgi:hypothetical protein